MKKTILIMVLLISVQLIFAAIYYVPLHYSTIQEAVNSVSSGDEIRVFDGTYYEDITINTYGLTLKSFSGPDNCTIDGNIHCITVNLTTVRIEGFTMRDASNTALVIQGGLSELKNCIFEDNEKTGMPLIGGSAITAWKPFDELSDCIFRDNEGAHTVVIFCDYPLGQPFPEVNETIKNNIFLNNTNSASYPSYGKDISLMNASINNYHGVLENNTFKGSTGGIYVEGIYGTADLNISNCVFDGSGISDDLFNQDLVIINYSCFSNSGYQNNYNWGDGNLTSTDPELNSTTCQPLWNSSVKSPCIDVGDPSLSDDNDGTPPDIGAVCAINHRIDEIELPPPTTDNGWKWLSFPALDDVLNNADIAGNILADILDPTILDKVETEGHLLDIQYSFPTWSNITQQFTSLQGFKFHMNEAATLDVPGFLEDPMTQISLVGNQEENWIGYFLEDSHDVEDAFAEIWDDLYFIWTQYWGMIKLQGEWYYHHPEDGVLEYGDMVIVKCDDPHNFRWYNDGPIRTKETIPKPDYFSYTQRADYIPIYLEFDPDDIPLEVGVFVNGECKGAAVVEGSETQVRTYLDDGQQGEIEFEFYYGNRGENKKFDSYNCLTSNNLDSVMKQLSTHDKADAWLVSFREESNIVPSPEKVTLSNYPNPFNPTTTIAYSLPNDGMIELRVYNIKGQLVKTLVSGEQLAGSYETVWNGKDNNGKNVSSGIYFYKLSTRDDTIMKKILMLK